MSKETALEKYAEAVGALKQHQKDNSAVFDAHQKLLYTMIDAENELRDAVAEAKEGVSGPEYKATYAPYTQTFVDPEELRASQGKTLSPDLIDSLIHVQERPPKISIHEA